MPWPLGLQGSVCNATPLLGPRQGSHSPPSDPCGAGPGRDSTGPWEPLGAAAMCFLPKQSPLLQAQVPRGQDAAVLVQHQGLSARGGPVRARAGRRFRGGPAGQAAPARARAAARPARTAARGLASRTEVGGPRRAGPPREGPGGLWGLTLSPPARKRSTAAPLMPCRSQSPARTSLMDSPALTSTTQDVPSGSWTLQCLVALSLSGAKVLQASDCGETGAGVTGRVRVPRRAVAGSHGLAQAPRHDKRAGRCGTRAPQGRGVCADSGDSGTFSRGHVHSLTHGLQAQHLRGHEEPAPWPEQPVLTRLLPEPRLGLTQEQTGHSGAH